MDDQNPYLATIDAENTAKLRQSLQVSVDKEPDTEAKLQQLAERYNLPVDTVRDDKPTIERRAKLDNLDYKTLIANYPATSNLLADPRKAAIAHDDVDNLSAMEGALKFGKDSYKTLGAGVFSMTAGIAGAGEASAKNIGDLFNPLLPKDYNPWYIGADNLKELRHGQQAWSDYLKPQADSNLGQGAISGAMSLAQNIPLTAAAVYSGNPSMALNAMAAITFGTTYGEDSDLGINTPTATLHGAANGLIEKYTEGWSFNRLLGDLKAGSSLVKTLLHQAPAELGGEMTATATQGLTDWVIQHPEHKLIDYLATLPDAEAQTLVATLVGLGGNAALLKGIDATHKAFNVDLAKASRADAHALNLEQLNKLAAASKVLGRSPDAIKTFVDSAIENGPVQNLYIDAKTFAQTGVADKIADLLPGVAAQFREALDTGGEISIPVSDYVAHLAGTEYAQTLADHLRVEGEEFTRAEAQVYMQTHDEELQAAVEKTIAGDPAADSFAASKAAVRTAILEQLNTLKRFTATKNGHDATLAAAWYATHAAKLGQTPEQMYERFPLNWAAESVGGEVFGQKKPIANTVEFGDFKTGVPVSFDFAHNTESATKIFGKPKKDAPYDRGIEPSGRYVTQVADSSKVDTSGSMIAGQLSFNNPLVLNVETWKQDLFDHYKKRGKALSMALIADGYDGVVTVSHDDRPGRTSTSEILDLTTFDKSKALYQTDNTAPRLAPNGKPSNLNPLQYAQVRTEAFKKWFGDWEAVARQNIIDAFIDKALTENDPRGSMVLRDVTDVERNEVLQQNGPDISGMQHILDAQEIHHAIKRHGGKDEKSQQPDQRLLTIDDLKRIAAVLDGYDNIKVQPRGNNQTSIIYSKEFPDGKIEYVERVFETSEKHKPRLVTKTVWVKVTTGVKPSPTQVYTPDHEANLPFKDGRVNPDLVSKVVDENGEPLVVYHGSDEQGFDTFLKEKIGSNIVLPNGAPRGFYFAKDKALAEKYGKTITAAFISGEPLLNNSKIVVAGEPTQIKSATGNTGAFDGTDPNILHQQQFGSFNPATNTIAIFKQGNLSTVLHELGHFFFENNITLASQLLGKTEQLTPGEQSIVNDVSALLTWHGITGPIEEQLGHWYTMDFEQKRSHHERTAESFEAYLFTGKAPSIELHSTFQNFRTWLLSVYKSITEFLKNHPEAGKLNPEVTAIFDRMLATDEQIELAEQARSLMPLFETAAKAGMTEADFAAYQLLGVDATNTAKEELQTKGLRDLQWLDNARTKSLKALQKQHDEIRKHVRFQAQLEIMALPVYQAYAFLTRKISKEDKVVSPTAPKSDPKSVDATIDSLFVAIAKMGGLQRPQLSEEWNYDHAGREHSPVFGKPIVRKNGGHSIKAMAEMLLDEGYLSFDEHGKYDLSEFETKFSEELRGNKQYSFTYDYSNLDDLATGGSHIVNPAALDAGRFELASLQGMGLEPAVVNLLINLKMTATDGLSPDLVADIIPGFGSGSELINALTEADNPKAAIEKLTNQRMLQDHAELATPEALQRAADSAVHNKIRARFVTTEANALAKATGSLRLLGTAAKDYATAMIARLKVRDITPMQYSRAEMKAARAAAVASKAGDTTLAATEKRNQVFNLKAARAAYAAKDNIDKILRYFKRFGGEKKNIDIVYINQIRALLDKLDLRNHSGTQLDESARLRTWVQSRLAEGELPVISESLLNPQELASYRAQAQSRDELGELVYNDDEELLKLLADAIDRSAKRSYKDATYEELLGLYDTIKQMEHLGRLKNKLLTARDQQSAEAIYNAIEGSIIFHGGKGGKNTRSPNDVLGKILVGIKDFGAAHIKVATWARIMDGGLDNGPVWRYLVKPANARAAQETTMKAASTKALDAIMRPILAKASLFDKSGKGQFFPSIGTSLNWQERFAMLLNMGNESNLQRLMGGGIAQVSPTLSMKQLLEVVGTLSWDEAYAAQQIWDHFESLRPLIAEKEKRMTGAEPDWIPIRAIDIKVKDGKVITLRGGYYPVKFDTRVNIRAEAHASAQEAKDMLKASYSAATTNRSFVKQRVEEVTGRPLFLNLTGLYSGINDVIHDLAWHEWVIDANKLLRNSKVDVAIREFYGAEVKKQFDNWRNDIVAGQRRLDHGIEKAAAFARQYVSASALTFNVMSAAMQPLGIANSVVRIGLEWTGKGVGIYLADMKGATQEAQQKSEWLRNRTRTHFRELNELRNQVQGQTAAKELMGRYGYWLMMQAQMMVDVPTWHGGYQKAIAQGFDENTAIAVADQGVKDSQGGGEEVDQSGIERGHAVIKLFTAFYGFMGTTLNTAYGSTVTEKSKGKLAANLLLTLTVPSVLGSLLRTALTPTGDDDKDWDVEKLLREQLSFLLGLIAGGREFSGLVNNNHMGYSGPTGVRVISDTFKLADQIGQGDFDTAFRKQFINVLGDLSGLPAVQINRSWTGIEALVDGSSQNPFAVAFGFKKPQ